MKITLYGAAGDVTGSSYYLQTDRSAILIDCGNFQGSKTSESKNRKLPPVKIGSLEAVILTHAHLDHCGRLPLLAKAKYHNPVYATPASIDIVKLILRDSLKVQNNDLEKLNRRLIRNGKPPLEPLFTEEEVEDVIKLLSPLPYHEGFYVAPGIRVKAVEAGHILGSASFEIEVTEQEQTKTVVFSGDLGPSGMPIVRDPEPPAKADLVFIESTYGDRDHKPMKETLDEFDSIISATVANKGKILVPSFAVGRTQDILYYLDVASHEGRLPLFPIYLDSPMAIEATKIYLHHPELYDEEMMALSREGQIQRDMNRIHATSSPEESRKINDVPGPCMIIAGSGMCNAGRILHHLRHNLWNPDTAVIIVGYQAVGTLGRRLVDGAKWVTIFGERISVRARIYKLGGFSAHAGQTDLLKWFNALAPFRPKVVLSHGEDRARLPLAKILRERYGLNPILPNYGDIIEL
ncbi:MAG: MBL fold metallo-hydrolase [bacterium]